MSAELEFVNAPVHPDLDPKRIAYALVADFIAFSSWSERVAPELRSQVRAELERIEQAMRRAGSVDPK